MIDVDYNEYKETISENMRLIQENHRLKKELEDKLHKTHPFLVENGIICDKNKEIERLTKQNKTLNEMYELTKKEYIRLNNIIEHIENICKSSIASVDKILLDEKEIKFKNGILQNRNNYQIVRLKAYRTKSKEILGRIKELKG